MIKLERSECPPELTKEVVEELTKIYQKDKEKDVWNNPRIKKPLKDALIQMSFGKCAYCECELNVESKDVTIDHFKPKVTNKDIVVEWNNLLPACLRCNRKKNRKETEIVNPCSLQPKDHIGVNKDNTNRLKGKDRLGKDTIIVVGLNDVDRVIIPRVRICEHVIEWIEKIGERMNHYGMNSDSIDELEKILELCRRDTEYAAVKATMVLANDRYIAMKEKLQKENKWNVRLAELEEELSDIRFELL